MFKSYIRAFREPFRQWDDFNSDKEGYVDNSGNHIPKDFYEDR